MTINYLQRNDEIFEMIQGKLSSIYTMDFTQRFLNNPVIDLSCNFKIIDFGCLKIQYKPSP